jgi:hypothetical protein
MIPFISSRKMKAFAVFLLINALMYLIIISAGTKNMWYDAPLYPLFATIIGISANDLMIRIRSRLGTSNANRSALIPLSVLLAALVLSHPFISTMREVGRTTEYPWDEEIYGISHFLRKRLEGNAPSGEITAILFNGYSGHLLFYTEAIGIKTGSTIPFRSPSRIRSGDIVLLSQQQVLEDLSSRFRYETVQEEGHARLIRIISAVPPR